jgi:hypothetical protein
MHLFAQFVELVGTIIAVTFCAEKKFTLVHLFFGGTEKSSRSERDFRLQKCTNVFFPLISLVYAEGRKYEVVSDKSAFQ